MQFVERAIVCGNVNTTTGLQQCLRVKVEYGQTCPQLLFGKEKVVTPVHYPCVFPAGKKLRVTLDIGHQIEYLSSWVGEVHRVAVAHGPGLVEVESNRRYRLIGDPPADLSGAV